MGSPSVPPPLPDNRGEMAARRMERISIAALLVALTVLFVFLICTVLLFQGSGAAGREDNQVTQAASISARPENSGIRGSEVASHQVGVDGTQTSANTVPASEVGLRTCFQRERV